MTNQPTLDDLPRLSVAAIGNTADRLGLDPVAFAQACQDGDFLATACRMTANGEFWASTAQPNPWLKQWAAIKAKGGK